MIKFVGMATTKEAAVPRRIICRIRFAVVSALFRRGLASAESLASAAIAADNACSS
jgi:hypothetical protein